MYFAYGSRQVSTIFAPSNQYKVILEVEPDYQLDQRSHLLCCISVRLPVGAGADAQLLVAAQRRVGPLSVNHLGQSNAVTISFNVSGLASRWAATALVEKEQIRQSYFLIITFIFELKY